MAKEKLNTLQKKQKPVTFRDTNHVQRIIIIGTRKLTVKNSLVTVQAPALIDALDNLYGMEREKK